MPREIWYLSLPFHLLSVNLFFSAVSLLHLSLSLFYTLLAVLCHCCNFLREKRNLNIYSADHLNKRAPFFPSVQGKSHKIIHISSSFLIFRSLVFLFVHYLRLHLFFPRLSISPLQEGAFTEQHHSPEQHCWGTPPPPALLPSPKCQIQIAGKLLEWERICSTSPNSPDSSYEHGYK